MTRAEAGLRRPGQRQAQADMTWASGDTTWPEPGESTHAGWEAQRDVKIRALRKPGSTTRQARPATGVRPTQYFFVQSHYDFPAFGHAELHDAPSDQPSQRWVSMRAGLGRAPGTAGHGSATH